MKRQRLIVLSTFLFAASGCLVFACSSGDDASTGDGGPDAKVDSTSPDSGNKDAGKDGTVTFDAGGDATVQDSGGDSTVEDAGDAGDAGEDADADDGAVTDAETDGGTVATFMVLRVGGDVDAGADAALSGASTQAYLEQRNLSDGSLVQTIALPIAINGSNQPITFSGNSTAEGAVALSADGHYVIVAGYGSAPGVATIKSTATDAGVPRIVARVDKNGAVDTTTELLAYTKTNIRGATSSDGTSFWAVGAGNSSEGPQYALLGSDGGSVNLSTQLANIRVAEIFDGQLYISSGSGAFHGVSMVGTGLPTTSGQTIALLPGMPGDAGSAYGFSMLDQDGAVSGLDVLYIADDNNNGTNGGIQKWVFDGASWTKIATFTDGTTSGYRGLAAYPSGNDIIVLGTTGDGMTVVKYVDDGTNTSPTGTAIATALTNTAYRGIALSPQ